MLTDPRGCEASKELLRLEAPFDKFLLLFGECPTSVLKYISLLDKLDKKIKISP